LVQYGRNMGIYIGLRHVGQPTGDQGEDVAAKNYGGSRLKVEPLPSCNSIRESNAAAELKKVGQHEEPGKRDLSGTTLHPLQIDSCKIQRVPPICDLPRKQVKVAETIEVMAESVDVARPVQHRDVILEACEIDAPTAVQKLE
jgi:hypothetical protein